MDVLIWIDFFIRTFLTALAWGLAFVTCLITLIAGLLVTVNWWSRMPRQGAGRSVRR